MPSAPANSSTGIAAVDNIVQPYIHQANIAAAIPGFGIIGSGITNDIKETEKKSPEYHEGHHSRSGATRADVEAQTNDLASEIVVKIGKGIKLNPTIEAHCADFASKVLEKIGAKVPYTAGATKLAEFVKAHGVEVPLNQTQPGDLIYYHGDGYGAMQNGKRSGGHVEVAVGHGEEISDHRRDPHKIYDPEHATAYRMPGLKLPDGTPIGDPAKVDTALDSANKKTAELNEQLALINKYGLNATESQKMLWEAANGGSSEAAQKIERMNASLQQQVTIATVLATAHERAQMASMSPMERRLVNAAGGMKAYKEMSSDPLAILSLVNDMLGAEHTEAVTKTSNDAKMAAAKLKAQGDKTGFTSYALDKANAVSAEPIYDLKSVPADVLKNIQSQWLAEMGPKIAESVISGMSGAIGAVTPDFSEINSMMDKLERDGKKLKREAGGEDPKQAYIENYFDEHEKEINEIRTFAPDKEKELRDKLDKNFDLERQKSITEAYKGKLTELNTEIGKYSKETDEARLHTIMLSIAGKDVSASEEVQYKDLAKKILLLEKYNEKLKAWKEQVSHYAEKSAQAFTNVIQAAFEKGPKAINFGAISLEIRKAIQSELFSTIQSQLKQVFDGLFSKLLRKPKDPQEKLQNSTDQLNSTMQGLISTITNLIGVMGATPSNVKGVAASSTSMMSSILSAVPGGGGLAAALGGLAAKGGPLSSIFGDGFSHTTSDGTDVGPFVTGYSNSGGGGGFGGILSGILGSIFHRESGGPVSYNSPYVVGEAGPELFVPSTGGSIMPTGSFGGDVTHNVHNTVNMYGVKNADRHSASQMTRALKRKEASRSLR